MSKRCSTQLVVTEWAVRCFGREHVYDPKVRAIRLLEEAIEFAQAVGADPVQCHSLIDYVYSRPSGQPEQELGGIGVTWLAAAESLHTDADDALQNEVARVLQKTPEYFAARNQVKLDAGFNGSPVAPSASASAVRELVEAAEKMGIRFREIAMHHGHQDDIRIYSDICRAIARVREQLLID